MKAIVYNAFGGPEVLRQVNMPRPEPGPGEVLVRIRAAGVNPIDWKIRNGQFECVFEHTFPVIPGWDMAGEVAGFGKDGNTWKIGDKVYAYTRFAKAEVGTYAEYIVVPERYLGRMPKTLSFTDAASIPLGALTAWQSLIDFAGLKKSESVLIHAGAGGVGSLAIPLAKYLGAKVVTTAQIGNHAYCRDLGANHCIDYRKQPYMQRLKELFPDGVNAVLDSVGLDIPDESLELLKPGGALICLNDPPDEKKAKKKKVRAIRLFSEPDGSALDEIAELIENDILPVPEIKILPLSQATKAQALNEKGHVRGKLVLEID